MSTRRDFVRTMGLSLAASAAASAELAAMGDAPRGGSERLLVPNPYHPTPAPVGVDRLPLAWYKAASNRLRQAAKARGVHAILLQTDTNLVYFTGCFRGSGERTTWALMLVDEPETLYWYSPAIDRDLITSWWCTENSYYFCYPHADGGFPNRGQNARGNRVDLWTWVLTQLKERGLAGKTIGLERELKDRPAGFRTHMLVAGAAALLVCIGQLVLADPRFNTNDGVEMDPLRMVEAVVAGVAFIGAGTIFAQRGEGAVVGITTAASLLMVAIVGVCIGFGYYAIAVGASLLTLLVLAFLQWMERRLSGNAAETPENSDGTR